VPPLRVVHLITGLYVGGAETMLYKLLERIDRACFENVVISLREIGPVGRSIEQLGIPVYSLGMKRGAITPGQYLALWGLLRRLRPALLQSWLYHADLLALVAGRPAGVQRIVWNLRSSDIVPHSARSTAWVVKACALLSGRPDAVICNSYAGKAFHSRQGYHPRLWAVMPNGFDLNRFKPDPEARASVRAELGICPEDVLIGLVARFDPAKDHHTFLRAALQLADADPRVQFLLAGSDVVSSNVEIESIVARHPARKRIHLLGERSDIPRITAALDIATCSSLSEGFANVIGEAMSCGVPCVVTDVGDSALIVANTGVTVPPGSPEALASGWRKLIEAGPAARAEMGVAARRRVEQNYSLEAVTRKYESLYQALSEK
jgi:glycosyltransferase involved in cell wall biosynthesis